jgi:hypothetical protein
MGFKAWFELLYKSKELLRDLYQPGLKRDRYFKMKRDFWALSFKRAGSKPNSYPVQTGYILYEKKGPLRLEPKPEESNRGGNNFQVAELGPNQGALISPKVRDPNNKCNKCLVRFQNHCEPACAKCIPLLYFNRGAC